jgi:hypothetical protein
MKTMPGTSFHDACKVTSAATPHAIHTSATASRKPGDDGRRPGRPGVGPRAWPFAAGAPRATLRRLDGLRPRDFGTRRTLPAVAGT